MVRLFLCWDFDGTPWEGQGLNPIRSVFHNSALASMCYLGATPGKLPPGIGTVSVGFSKRLVAKQDVLTETQ